MNGVEARGDNIQRTTSGDMVKFLDEVNAPAKEPWQMTKAEAATDIRETANGLLRQANKTGKPVNWAGFWHGFGGRGWLTEPHEKAVKAAIAEGKPVPPEVLAEYPSLKATAEPVNPPVKAGVPTPAVPPQAELEFESAYRKELETFSKEREKAYPSAQLMSDWKTLQDTGKLETSFGRGGKSVAIETKTRMEKPRKGKPVSVKSYSITTKNGTYIYDWGSNTEYSDDWAAAKALARGLADRVSDQSTNPAWIHTAMVNGGDYTSWDEKQWALHEALKSAMPGVTVPNLSTVVKVPAHPTLQDAFEAVAESLPRNLGDIPDRATRSYGGFAPSEADKISSGLDELEKRVKQSASIIGKDHPRVQEIQKLIDERRASVAAEEKLEEARRATAKENERRASEADARRDAEYYARFGTTDGAALPNLERYARLAGWKETGEALNERALKEFGIEKKQITPLDISGLKLKASELNLLRDARLSPGGTFLPKRLTQGQESELKARGWLDEKGIQLTKEGERAALGVAQADAQGQAGRPMSEYKASGGRVPDPDDGVRCDGG